MPSTSTGCWSRVTVTGLSLGLLLVVVFLAKLLTIVSRENTSQLGNPRYQSSFSPRLKKMFLWTGSSIAARPHGLSVVVLSPRRFPSHVERLLRSDGTFDLFHDTPRYVWVNHPGWIPSVLSASIGQPSMITSTNSGRYLMQKAFHGQMYTTWMRKAVSEEEGDECRPLNTLFLAINSLGTIYTAPIWNWSLSLSVSVQMASHFHQVSSSLGRNSTPNGTIARLHTPTSGELDKLLELMRIHFLFKYSIGVSENGWTDDFLCEEWFCTVFIPQSKACNASGAPILLILDGHGSHITKAIRQLTIDNNIEIFCLPAHTTHQTQPLDVGIFGPLQLHWMRQCDEVLDETGEEILIVDFVNEYMAV